MAVCSEGTKAEIRGVDGIDCCELMYCANTALLVKGTPVIFDIVCVMRSKVATPKSGCGVLIGGGGGTLTGGSTNACTCEPSWSKDRKNRSLPGPSVSGTTVPRFDSSWPLAAV